MTGRFRVAPSEQARGSFSFVNAAAPARVCLQGRLHRHAARSISIRTECWRDSCSAFSHEPCQHGASELWRFCTYARTDTFQCLFVTVADLRAGLFARGTLPVRRVWKFNRQECWRGSCSPFRTSHDSTARRSLGRFDDLCWIELQVPAAGLRINVAFENHEVSITGIKSNRNACIPAI